MSASVSSPPGPEPGDREPAFDHPLDRRAVQNGLDTGERQGVVEPQAEHHPFSSFRRSVESLELARRLPTGLERGDVARDGRRVAATQVAEGRHGPDPDAEVVAPVPIAEVVVRAEIPAGRRRARQAEVRRLVPAVTGRRQRVDDMLEIPLHRLRLPYQLAPEDMCEARARLRFELVQRQVLRGERQCLREIVVEVGELLARDPIDQIEGDVVERGSTKGVHRPPDIVWTCTALEDLEQPRSECLGAERDACHPALAQECRELCGDGLRVRLDGHLRGRR